MKKILFLFLICVIKLSAYEYIIQYNKSNDIIRFYSSENDILNMYQTDLEYNNQTVLNESAQYVIISNMRKYGNLSQNLNYGYISTETFESYYKNDLNFLNDLYTQRRNIFLNYLYNENEFTDLSYIIYENYELLYNSDGLAVESIVNGEWKGLYDNKEESGYLYNSNGQLIYKNGVELKGINLLVNLFIVKILNAFNDIDWDSIKLIPVIILTLSLFFFLLIKFKGVLRGRFKSVN